MTPADQPRDQVSSLTVIVAGGLGGMAYWSAFYPADTVKTAIQTASSAEMKGGKPPSFASMFARIYRTKGIAGLYNGLGPTLLRAMPANAGVFFTYEMCTRLSNKVLFGLGAGVDEEE